MEKKVFAMTIQKKYVLIILVPFIILFLFVSVNTKPIKHNPIPYTVLEEGVNASYRETEPEIHVFVSHNSFGTFYNRVHQNKIPKSVPPAVDFTKNAVVFVSYGEQKSAGYSIDIRTVFGRNTTLIVKAILISPPQESFQAQVITHPYIFLLVPLNGYKRIELVNEIGEVQDFIKCM